MLLRNRQFERQPPSREAKSFYIFCEGAKRERMYFEYFQEIDSRINIEVYPLSPKDNNSPIGLFQIAEKSIVASKENPNPRYQLEDIDEVWIVMDTDPDKLNTREPQFIKIESEIKKYPNWKVVLSNPCFEVWLYYHQFKDRKSFEGDEKCAGWKKFVGREIKGGFNSNKHPVLIQNAIENARKNYAEIENLPEKGATQVFRLGESMMRLLRHKFDQVLTGNS